MITIVARSFDKAYNWAQAQDPPIPIPNPNVIILLTDDPGAAHALRGRGPINAVHHVGDYYMGRYAVSIEEDLNAHRAKPGNRTSAEGDPQAPEGGV